MVNIVIPEIHILETTLIPKHLLMFIVVTIVVLLVTTKSWNYW